MSSETNNVTVGTLKIKVTGVREATAAFKRMAKAAKDADAALKKLGLTTTDAKLSGKTRGNKS